MKSKVPMLSFMKKIPGGLMIVPMLVTAIINTIFPAALTIGGPTTAVFKSGTLCIAGIILFIAGAKLNIKQLKAFAKRGSVYTILKVLVGFGSGIIFTMLFGESGILGISAVAFISCMYSCNPGVYAGVASDYGDDIDRSLMSLIMLLCMQALGVTIIEITSGAGFDVMNIVNILAPWLLGFICGNLDPDLAKFLAPGTNICLPFIGCCFGASINLVTALKSGLAGILLCLLFYIINIPIMWGVGDKVILKREGWCGMAFNSVAGISISLPALVAQSHPNLDVGIATAQIALVVVITSYVTPYLCKACVKKKGATPGSPYELRKKENAAG